MDFFIGLHNVAHAHRFDRAFISINRIRDRKSDFEAKDWILDSGAFTELTTYGSYREGPEMYAEQINRWGHVGNMLASVTQDYMCEPFVLKKTGLSVPQHQRLTTQRYVRIQELTSHYVMPVLQGYDPMDYVGHIMLYGDLLKEGMWVGVGSVCKRNNSPVAIAQVLSAIKLFRPDLRLHGFGLKQTALSQWVIREMLHSADSMAWSFAARREGRDANSWQEAKRFEHRIVGQGRREQAA